MENMHFWCVELQHLVKLQSNYIVCVNSQHRGWVRPRGLKIYLRGKKMINKLKGNSKSIYRCWGVLIHMFYKAFVAPGNLMNSLK